MTLDEFKNIFYWEWSHRMIGRFIGASFILPGLYFATKGHMSRRVAKQTFGITCLLGFQVNTTARIIVICADYLVGFHGLVYG